MKKHSTKDQEKTATAEAHVESPIESTPLEAPTVIAIPPEEPAAEAPRASGMEVTKEIEAPKALKFPVSLKATGSVWRVKRAMTEFTKNTLKQASRYHELVEGALSLAVAKVNILSKDLADNEQLVVYVVIDPAGLTDAQVSKQSVILRGAGITSVEQMEALEEEQLRAHESATPDTRTIGEKRAQKDTEAKLRAEKRAKEVVDGEDR